MSKRARVSSVLSRAALDVTRSNGQKTGAIAGVELKSDKRNTVDTRDGKSGSRTYSRAMVAESRRFGVAAERPKTRCGAA
jgi:hypothetical protein